MVKIKNSVLLSFVFMFLLTLPCFARAPTISVGVAAGMQGETVTIPVRMSDNPGINTFSLGFEYDRSKLILLDITPAEKLGGQFKYQKKAVWLNNSDVKLNGDILYLRFLLKDTAPSEETEVRITYSSGDISNYDERDIDFATTSSVVIIGIEQNKINWVFTIIIQLSELFDKMKI